MRNETRPLGQGEATGKAGHVLIATTLFMSTPVQAQSVPSPPTPIAPSQVTPRSLRPALPAAAAPIDFAEATPADVPTGADGVRVRVRQITVVGDFPELQAASRGILAPLEGREVSVGDLYRGAAALEKAYSDAGYFLARVLIAKQRLQDGDAFHIQIVDGFIEQIDTSALPARAGRPVARLLSPVVGRRHLLLAEITRRLTAAGDIPGISLRSTLARGELTGGARLVLDGRHQLIGASIGGDNRLGRSFNNWGINFSGQLDSPLGLGEQFYVFLSGEPRLDRAFRKSAARRVAGVGALVPLTANGLAFNPEFTVSDTHPIPGIPILATSGRLYRGAASLIKPLVDNAAGRLVARGTLEIVSETQRLPFFGVTLSKDRLTVVRGNLSWRGGMGRNGTLALDGTLSHGTRLFGARTPGEIARSQAPASRGSDPQFTVADAQAVVGQAIGAASSLTVIARVQSSFGDVLPSSELFDLTGLDSLSPFTAGALSADGGASLRGELAHRVAVKLGGATLNASPYLFGAVGSPDPTIEDPFTPTFASAYGLGLRLAGNRFPLGAAPTFTLEYGRRHANRGAGSGGRLSVLFGVSF